MNQIQDDDFDLFELFQTLWDGKWLISAFVATAVLFGAGLIFVKEKEKEKEKVLYESKLFFSVDRLPPFHNDNHALTDFYKKFHSINVFENWKKRDGNVSITFEDFSTTQVIDGFVLSKDESQRLATLMLKKRNKRDVSFVLVKSNQLSVLDDFFKYAQYINELLRNEYVGRSNEKIANIKSLFKNPLLSENFCENLSLDNGIVRSILSIDRYIDLADKEAKVFAIQRPTIPKRIETKHTKPSLILAFSFVFGVMIGVFFILVRNAIKKRKEQLAKA
jgi:hypothetical protein